MKKNLEVTTYIGCKVLCKYCPQDKIVRAYDNLKAKTNMTLSDFKKILSNVDKNDTKLIFAGFSECFVNRYAIDMLIYAYQQGFKIDIFTTMVGLTKSKILKLKKAEVGFYAVAFHFFKSSDIVFKKDKFYDMVEFFRNNIKVKVSKIVEVRNVVSRAGALFKIKKKTGNIVCLCNSVYQNVVLPNGDVFLCCNDFELKHKLGNLFEDHYSSDKIEQERKKILELMKLKDSEIACRLCETSDKSDTKDQIKFGINKDFLNNSKKVQKRIEVVNKLKIKKENI
ncbi:MAG: SPASM domain-containing protein [Endomicrobiia bacterium]|nr:SPASM domain-containing protein [Endomicrobiaceae bacterium]MDD3922912.1 SPASM domain-containing protein [Endomicrobiaceae bacterium]MDD5101985.1 SPASM domain-containing protein [Endomicrobiaceae bacterium]